MNKFEAGDVLILLQDAIDPENQEKLYSEGTIAKLLETDSKHWPVRFPDGQIFGHDPNLMPFIFRKFNETAARTVHGSGTPPKGLMSFMPKEAEWQYNYYWSLTIHITKGTRKEFICQDCYTELPGDEKSLQEGTMCSGCKLIKTPISVSSIIETT